MALTPRRGLTAWLDRLPLGRFGRSVAKIAGGTAIGQGLVMASTPLLTRLFAPRDFGLLGVYVSLLSMVLVIASLRFEMAISLPRDEDDAVHLVVLSLLALGFVTAVTLVACGLGGALLAKTMKSPGLAPYLVWLLPIGVAGGGAYQILSAWAVRECDYASLAKTRVSQGVAQVFSQVGIGLLIKGPVGLLVGADIGRISGTGTMVRSSWKGLTRNIGAITWRRLWQVAERYKEFPLVNSFSALVNALGLYLPVVVISMGFGENVAGQFSLSQRIIALPIALIGQAMAMVFNAESAVLIRESPEALDGLVLRTIRKLIVLGLLPTAALAFLGQWGFRLIFGPAWGQAGLFVQVMAPMFILQFVAWPLSQILLLLEHQVLQLALDLGRMMIVVLALLVPAHLALTPIWAVGCYGLTLAVYYLATLLLIRAKTRVLSRGKE